MNTDFAVSKEEIHIPARRGRARVLQEVGGLW